MPPLFHVPKTGWTRVVLALACAFWGENETLGQGTLFVRPEAPSYLVAPGQRLTVNVVLERTPATGIFSYGVTLAFDALKASLAAGDIAVPSPLAFNGFAGPGPIVEASAGFAGVKGTVDVTASTVQPYLGSLLASFLIQATGEPGTSFPLELGLFRTLGATESVFIDGTGTVLDDQLVFGSAIVTIVPEPAVLALLGAGAGLLPFLKRRFSL